MSSGKTKEPSTSPTLAGMDSSDMATNQRSVPAHYFAGIDWCPLTWLTDIHFPVYKDVKQKVGKKESKVGEDVYGSLAGLACVGMADAILGIEVDKQVVWQGTVERDDNPASPNYHKATITTSAGKFHIYWGRPDQPLDTILLARLKTLGIEHPAYRRQTTVICDNIYFGQNKNSASDVRVKLRRAPKPRLGNFPAQLSPQGESIVAAVLELLTDTMFGASMPVSHFTAADWESVSAAVIARVGCHAPSLDRERPAKDVVKDLFSYFDGWCRLEKQMLTPGFFPHDGNLPADLPVLNHHDFADRPKLPTRKIARAANSVLVNFRDGTQLLRDDSVGDTAAASRRARQRVQPVKIDMPAIIDRGQALAYAAIAARAPADDAKGSVIVRTPRAINPTTGQRLRAGDNFRLDFQPLNYSRIVRITKRTEDYKGKITLDVVPERGCYPAAATVTPDPLPNIGVALPQPVEAARVLELPPTLAGSPIGIYIAILAQRPVAKYPAPHDNLTAQNINSAAIWFSLDGGSYDWTGAQTTWAVRCLSGTGCQPVDGEAAGSSGTGCQPVQIVVTPDPANIDLDRIVAQSESSQLDDTLLLIIDDEILSVGAIQLGSGSSPIENPESKIENSYTCHCLRGRCGTRPASHSPNSEAWLVFRDDLGRYAHAQFAENVQAHFKLETCNPGNRLPLEDAPDIAYTFRDRAPEAPAILFDALPANAQVGIATTLGVQFGDSNGDLDRYRFEAQRLDTSGTGSLPVDGEAAGSSATGSLPVLETLPIAAGAALPVEQTMLTLRLGCVFPRSGTWRLHALASDLAQNTTELFSEPFAILPNTTGATFETAPAPPPVPGVIVDGGFQQLTITLRQDRITEVLGWQLSVQTTAGAIPAVTHDALQTLTLTISALPASTTRHIRARALGKNGLPSDWSAEVTATTLALDTATVTQSLADARQSAAAAAQLAGGLDDKIRALADATDGTLATVNKSLSQLSTTRDAFARDLSNITTLINGNYGDIERDSQAHTDAEESLATDIETLRSTFDTSAAALQQSLKTQADALTALSQRADTLYANYKDAQSAITAETTARSDADTAFTQQLTQLTSTYQNALDDLATDLNDSLATLRTDYNTHAGKLTAIAETLDTLTTQAGQNTAAITKQSTATADALKASARDTANLTSLLNDAHAALQLLAETLIDADGNIIARWGVTLDANGSTAEMEMFARGGPDPVSQITFKADLVSKNYDPRKAGWRVACNGDAEFNAMLLRNCLTTGTLGKISLNQVGSVTITNTVDLMFSGPAGLAYRYTEDGSQVTPDAPEWPKSNATYAPMTISASRWIKVRGFDADGLMTEEAQVIINKSGAVSTPPPVNAHDTGIGIPGSANGGSNGFFQLTYPDTLCSIVYRLTGYMTQDWQTLPPAAAGTVKTIPAAVNWPTDLQFNREKLKPGSSDYEAIPTTIEACTTRPDSFDSPHVFATHTAHILAYLYEPKNPGGNIAI